MYHCNPLQGERCYLRLLLTVQRGATSYANLRTIRDTEYPTYQQACLVLGLLEDNREWIQCFQETVVYATGGALCTLFATAIMYGSIHDPHDLWLRFRQHFCDDLPHRLQQLTVVIPPDLVDPRLITACIYYPSFSKTLENHFILTIFLLFLVLGKRLAIKMH